MSNPIGQLETSGRYSAITTGDTSASNFSSLARAIYVGVAGDVVCVRDDGTAVTFKNAQSGSWIPVKSIRINSTNTTATNLVALF